MGWATPALYDMTHSALHDYAVKVHAARVHTALPVPSSWQRRKPLHWCPASACFSLCAAFSVAIRLQHRGVFFAGEFLAVGHPHHIGENLQTIAVRIEEVERATAAAANVAASLKAMDERSTDRLHPMGVQMGQGLEKLVPVLDLKGDLLDQPLALAGSGDVHAWPGQSR